MTDAEDAFKRTKDIIIAARDSGAQVLSLDGDASRALTRLPDEIADCTALDSLDLSRTQVSDLSPISGLTELKMLFLEHTKVSDLTPLSSLTALQELYLTGTPAIDISPLSSLAALQQLHLDDTQVSDLSPLANLTALQWLYLDGTRVSDLSPLANLTALGWLYLSGTRVSNLSPLSNLTVMQRLNISHTHVNDLRPVHRMEALASSRPFSGLSFDPIPALDHDPKLYALSQIEDDRDRTRRTLDYLRSLPPYPQPLPGQPPQAPAPIARPLLLLADDRVDVVPATADAECRADPIRETLYNRLPDLLNALASHTNRDQQLDAPLRRLLHQVQTPFAEADFLALHLDILSLTDIHLAQDSLPAAERIDAECDTALRAVLRVAPGVTIGQPDVVLLEQRLDAHLRKAAPPQQNQAERQITAALADTPDLATERARHWARATADGSDSGRIAGLRHDFTRNLILLLGGCTVTVGHAAAGVIANEGLQRTALFLTLHKDAILATAPAWGETGYIWASYVIDRAQQILDQLPRA